MLLSDYRKEIIRPECRREAESLHCIAHLNEDIGEVLPYLNSVLGGSIPQAAAILLISALFGLLINELRPGRIPRVADWSPQAQLTLDSGGSLEVSL